MLSESDLRPKCRGLETNALIDLCNSGKLTDAAIQVATDELHRRGVRPNSNVGIPPTVREKDMLSESDLRPKCRGLETNALLDLCNSGKLTDAAIQVATDELHRRGVRPNSNVGIPPTATERAQDNGRKLYSDDSISDPHSVRRESGAISTNAAVRPQTAKLTGAQLGTVLVTAAVAIGMLLWPPFELSIRGTTLNMGYGFLLSPPSQGSISASVNVPLLLLQWGGVALVAGAGFVFFGNSRGATERPRRLRDPFRKTFAEKLTFFLLRLSRGFGGLLFGWQIFTLLPLLTWIIEPRLITGNMIAQVGIKLVFLLVSGTLFFLMRRLIHWVHTKWYGRPHPALTKRWAL